MSIEITPWGKKLEISEKAYKEWEGRFRCSVLEKYYEGFQFKDVQEKYPYVVNFFYATINEKIAAHLFGKPQFKVTPKPGFSDFDLSFAIQSAQIKEDTLNTIIQRDDSYFEEEVESAFLDSFFRYGIIEVGYSANWVINPQAGKPVLRSFKKNELYGREDSIVRQPEELPENEQIFFKRIRPNRFRVGGIDSSYLTRCDWVAYYDYVLKADLLGLPGIKNKDQIRDSIGSSVSYSDIDEPNYDYSSIVKIWHVWSNREKKRYLLLDSPSVELWSDDFERLPLFGFRWDRRTSGWYPIPPSFQWVSSQDEINDARRQLKNHRKRFIRKFQALEGSIDDIERDKFESEVDGELVTVKRENAISAIETASLGAESDKSVMIAKDDFNTVSGTANEVRGTADRMTATQARAIEGHASRRETKTDVKVSKWVCAIGREALLLARDKFTMGTWIKLNVDPQEDFMEEVKDQQAAYRWVSSEDLSDGYDFRIDVDITSMSPQRFDEEKAHYIEFLSLMSQFPQVALSPALIRETAYRCNYRNERVIKEFQKVALITMLGQANQQAQAGGQGNQIAQGNVEQQTPNTQAEIENQMAAQSGRLQ